MHMKLKKGESGDMMLIQIDFNSNEAIYQQLCDQIILGIATARFAEGDALPSVRQLADDIGINMHTVNKAYTVLKQEGYVKVDRRRGAVIAVDYDQARAMQAVDKQLRTLLAEARCRGLSRVDIHCMVDDICDEYDEYCADTGRTQETARTRQGTETDKGNIYERQ